MGFGVKPCAARRLATSGSFKTATTSLFRNEITRVGVPAGASRPSHVTASKPGTPASLKVGSSGASGERVAVVMASALACPFLAKASAVAMLSNCMSMRLPARSSSDWLLPLYGTWTALAPSWLSIIKAVRCCEVPMPLVPYETASGLALILATSSCTLWAPDLVLASRTSGVCASRVMGAKSFSTL